MHTLSQEERQTLIAMIGEGVLLSVIRPPRNCCWPIVRGKCCLACRPEEEKP